MDQNSTSTKSRKALAPGVTAMRATVDSFRIGLESFLTGYQELVDRVEMLEGRLTAQALTIVELERQKSAPPIALPVAQPKPDTDDLLIVALRAIRDHGPKLSTERLGKLIECNQRMAWTLIDRLYRKGWVTKGFAQYAVTERGHKALSVAAPVPEPAKVIPLRAGPAVPSVARLEFVNHLRMFGRIEGLDDEKMKECFNAIYARMATVGMDPRGKNAAGKKVKPVDFIEQQGWAGDALKLAREMYPLREKVAV